MLVCGDWCGDVPLEILNTYLAVSATACLSRVFEAQLESSF